MSATDSFSITLTKSLSKNDVSFHEIQFSCKEDPIEITFRAYPKNVFVAVDDQRDCPFSGADLEDCAMIPPTIIEKTPKEQFSPRDAFLKACVVAFGEYDHSDLWSEVVEDVVKWVRTWTPKCFHYRVKLHSKLYAAQTRYEPAEYIARGECLDCGEWMESEDIPEDAEVKE